MIRLSIEQMLLIAGLRRQRFRERTTDFVMKSFPLACAGLEPEQIAGQVAVLEESGIVHGICGKQELSRFISYHFLLKETGEVCPETWIAGIVSMPGSGMARIHRLDQAVQQLLEEHGEPEPAT